MFIYFHVVDSSDLPEPSQALLQKAITASEKLAEELSTLLADLSRIGRFSVADLSVETLDQVTARKVKDLAAAAAEVERDRAKDAFFFNHRSSSSTKYDEWIAVEKAKSEAAKLKAEEEKAEKGAVR